jgi:hypothetical protein
MAQHAATQPSVPRDRWLIVAAECQIRHDGQRADAAVEQRLLGEQEDTVALHFGPCAAIGLTVDDDGAADGFALPRQDFDELLLPVTGNAGNA